MANNFGLLRLKSNKIDLVYFSFYLVADGCCVQNEVSLDQLISGEPVISRNSGVRCTTVAVFVAGETTENRAELRGIQNRQPLTLFTFCVSICCPSLSFTAMNMKKRVFKNSEK